MPRKGISILFLSLFALLGPRVPPATAAPDAADLEPRRQAAVARGLKYLAAAYPRLAEPEGTPRRQFTAATAGLVLLLAPPVEGLRAVRREILLADLKDYLIRYLEEVETRSRDERELPRYPGRIQSWSLVQYTWPCAVALLFFHEMQTRGLHVEESKDAVERLVAVLQEAQQENGGWGHGRTRKDPTPTPEERAAERRLGRDVPANAGSTYPNTLVASSALVAAALGLARHALDAPGWQGRDAAVTYFEDAQLRNGNYPYDPSQRTAMTDRTGAGRAAGAVFALWAMGVPLEDRTIRRSLKYLDAHLEDVTEGHGSATLTLLFGALAARVRGTEAWTRFKETFFPRMLDEQRPDGSFVCICEGKVLASTNDSELPSQVGDAGILRKGADAYVTALHLWILLLESDPPRALSPPTTSSPSEGPRPSPITPR